MDVTVKAKPIIQVRNDDDFHYLFNEEDMDTITWMVAQILECDVDKLDGKVKIKNARISKIKKDNKQKYVDLLIQYNKQKIVVELNNHFNGLYVRNYTYIFSVLANSFKSTRKGKDKYYREKINGILVNLNWNIKRNKKLPGKVVYELPRTCHEKNFFLKVININLDYYENLDNVSTYEKLWKLLTLKTSVELKKFIKNNQYLQRYGERVLELSKKKESDNMLIDPIMDKNLKREEDYYEGFCDGEEEGEKRGEARGEKQGALKNLKQMVKSFYKNGVSLDLISASSGLSIDEINKIVIEKK